MNTKFTYTHPDELVVISLGDDVRYNPNQPRDGDGKWTSSGGMGGGAYESLDDAQRARVDRAVGTIQRKQEKFQQQGGTIVEHDGLPDEQFAILESDLTDLVPMDEDGYELEASKGVSMMVHAFEKGAEGETVVQARAGAGGGTLVGLASYKTGVSSPSKPFTEFSFAGTTDRVDGAGTAMFSQVVRSAAAAGEEIRLTPLDDYAIAYWQHMGFVSQASIFSSRVERMVMSADVVQAIAEKIG